MLSKKHGLNVPNITAEIITQNLTKSSRKYVMLHFVMHIFTSNWWNKMNAKNYQKLLVFLPTGKVLRIDKTLQFQAKFTM